MEKIFDSVGALDTRAETAFNLKNGALMEHAARGIAERIRHFLFPVRCLQRFCPKALRIVPETG